MKFTMTGLRSWALALALFLTIGIVAIPGSQGVALAQSTTHHKNFIQRHAMASSMAAGYAAYKAAKITGNRRAMYGHKKNFAQRHPMLTGAATAMAAHHMIKKSMKH